MIREALGKKVIDNLCTTNLQTLNGKYQVIEMNKSWWLKRSPNLNKNGLFNKFLEDKSKSDMTAVMVYRKNEYLLLVPWVKNKHCKYPKQPKPKVTKEDATDKDKHKDEDCDECDDNNPGVVEDAFRTMLVEHTYVLFDKTECSEKLKD